jgi:hypothetical protein
MKHLLFLIALAVSAQQIKINPITGLPDLVGSGGGGGAVSSVTAGPLGAITVSPTTGATVVDVDPAYVPNKVGTETIIGDWTFYDSTAVTGVTTLKIRAGAGQSTTNLQEWQNNSGTPVANIAANGIGDFAAVTSTDYVQALRINFPALGAFKPESDGVFSLKDAAGTSVNRLQFGGTTSSFPSLKRSSAALQVRLADDSGDADLIQRHPLAGGTSPTITSGFGTTPSIAGKDAAGRVTVGTGGTAATGTITFGTAWTTAPVCTAANETSQITLFPTATTTTLVLASTTPFNASDKLVWICVGF